MAFALEYKDDTSERSEAQSFWTDFLRIFGVERRRVKAAFERDAIRSSTGRPGRIDLLWDGMLLAEHKSAGESLELARKQALDYVDSLSHSELPRLVVASDFKHFAVLDLEAPDDVFEFPLEDLPKEIDRFLVLAGYTTRRFEESDAVNIEAAELLAQIYMELEAGGYVGERLGVFIVRVLFLLFGDSTGLWPRQAFGDFLRNRTNEDGSDLGMWLTKLFTVLDAAPGERSANLDEDLAAFPYVNGGLFAHHFEPPDTTRKMHEQLSVAAGFDWSGISPAIFGSMFQAVMDKDARKAIGAHYTSEQNIMKVIGPLFLDDLKAELAKCGNSAGKLRNFHDRLASLNFLDPACGCGNFLVIAYREIRALETELLERLHAGGENVYVQQTIDLESWRKVDMTQFAGIEILEFPARIAETAMYLMDHLANEDLSTAFGHNIIDLPLQAQSRIVVGNALDMDWNSVVSSAKATYVYGNPPFAGKKRRTAEQSADMDRVFGGAKGSAELDYVSAWFEKAVEYISGTSIKVAFVATNSITQGEQVPLLWPRILDAGVQIGFAYRTFAWSSQGRGMAHVHCVIIGFRDGTWPGPIKLYDFITPHSDPIEAVVKRINPYLADAPTVYLKSRRKPLCDVPRAMNGSMPNDDGHLIIEDADVAELISSDAIAAKFVRPMASSKQLLEGTKRWCLWLPDSTAAERSTSPVLRARIKATREYRESSTRAATVRLAETPYLFGEIRQPDRPYLCVPRHASETYVVHPMEFATANTIASDSTITIAGADNYLFGILESAFFTAWLHSVAGRIKSDPRFSVEVVYNNFPFPDPNPKQRAVVAAGAHAVLAARKLEGGATLGDLYDPNSMPAALRKAHHQLDRAVDAAFIGARRKLTTNAERLAILFNRYEVLSATQSD
jgi:hypothetical protein